MLTRVLLNCEMQFLIDLKQIPFSALNDAKCSYLWKLYFSYYLINWTFTTNYFIHVVLNWTRSVGYIYSHSSPRVKSKSQNKSWQLVSLHRKHETLTQCCCNVAPASPTLAQHCSSIAYPDCWVCSGKNCEPLAIRAGYSAGTVGTSLPGLALLLQWDHLPWRSAMTRRRVHSKVALSQHPVSTGNKLSRFTIYVSHSWLLRTSVGRDVVVSAASWHAGALRLIPQSGIQILKKEGL